MKCFNHTEREAVATCQKCGKGLCRECAEKHTPCLCDPCAVQIQYDQQQQAQIKEEQRKQKYKAALADSRGDFIKTAIIGILVGIFFVRWDVHGGNGNVDTSFIDNVGMFCVAFCIPFGWRFITYLQSFFPISLFGTFWFWIIYIGVKGFLSILVGIPAFIFQIVKMILAQSKVNKLN